MRKLPSKRWQASYVGPDLARHLAPDTFDDEDAARGWLARERSLIENEQWTPPAERAKFKRTSGYTFEEYANEWLPKRRTRTGEKLKPRTLSDYRRYLDDDLLPEFGALPLRQVTVAAVQEWFDGMDPETPTRRAHAYQLLRAICTTAHEEGLMTSNPCTISGGGRTNRAKHIRPATPAEFLAIANNMPERLRMAVLLGGWCALRYGEIAELRRKDVDTKNGVVRIARGVTWPMTRDEATGKLTGSAVVSTPKSEAGDREVHVPPHLVAELAEHVKKHADPGRNGLLFPNSTGGHIHPRTFGWRFHQARKEAGRPDLRFHDLRHSSAVLAAMSGATIKELMSRLGHSTPAAAMRYQHAAEGRDRAIAAAMSKFAQNE